MRVPEPATSLRVCLLLEARSFDLGLPHYRETLFELAVSALASIAVYLQQAGCPVGLYADATPPAALPPSAGEGQLRAILEALARVEPLTAPRASGWAEGGLPRGSAVVVATSDVAAALPARVALLEQAGHPVLWLRAGERPAAGALGAERVVHLRPDADLAAALEGER